MKKITFFGVATALSVMLAACDPAPSSPSSSQAPATDANDPWTLFASPTWDSEREEVVKTGTGLEYVVLKAGPTCSETSEEGDRALAHYEGRLTDGTVFDASFRRNEPLSFWNNQVIAGWREGLSLMCPGDDWLMYIPADLAYGSTGAGALIGPNEDLIFRVVLLTSIPKDEWTGDAF